MIYSNTRRIKRGTRNIKHDLRHYVTWLQLTSSNRLYHSTTIAPLGFFLLIPSYLRNKSELTMELSSWNNYKRMRFHCIHNGTRLLPPQYYSLEFKTENYLPNLDNSHSKIKISFSLHTFPSKTLDFSSCHVITGETIPQVPKIRLTSSSFLPKRQPISNITPLAHSDSMMKLTMLS